MVSAFGIDHGGVVSKASAAAIAASQKNAHEIGQLARYVKGEPRKRDYILAGAVGGGIGGGTGGYLGLKQAQKKRRAR